MTLVVLVLVHLPEIRRAFLETALPDVTGFAAQLTARFILHSTTTAPPRQRRAAGCRGEPAPDVTPGKKKRRVPRLVGCEPSKRRACGIIKNRSFRRRRPAVPRRHGAAGVFRRTPSRHPVKILKLPGDLRKTRGEAEGDQDPLAAPVKATPRGVRRRQ